MNSAVHVRRGGAAESSGAGVTRVSRRFGELSVRRTRIVSAGTLLPERPSAGSVRVHFIASGEARYRLVDRPRQQDAEDAVLRTGEAVIATDPTAIELTAPGECEVTTITVANDTLMGLGLEPPSIRRVDDSSPLLAPVAVFAAEAARVGDAAVTGFSRYYFERLLQEMVLSLLVDTSRAQHMPRQTDTFALAMAIIGAQYADPAFSAVGLARELRMSVRQVERAFRARSTTITGELRSARLEQAESLLRDETYRGLTVDEVGRYVGFSGGSSLARAMTRAGRPAPADIRRG